MPVIDCHMHLGQGVHLSMCEGELLARMDEAGTGIGIACPVDRFLAVANREGNDLLIAVSGKHKDRIFGMAAANPWYGGDAVKEIRRALEKGLRGLVLHPVYQGFRLSDTIVDPLIRAAEEYGVPVYVHTGTAGIAEPFHAVELARRHPGVNFIMGHAGSSDYGEDAVRALEFAPNIWLETSRNGPANYNFWRVKKCVSRVVFGSGAPEYIPSVEIDILKEVFTDPAEQRAIFEDNIHVVFRGRLRS